MCGIVAYKSEEKTVNPEVLKNALNKIAHRGPDFSNIWLSDDKKTAFGHARLSIIDLKNGNQPFVDKKHGISAVVNGEFYGYREIKKDLSAKGYYFQTDSDSEIIINLYLEYGFDLFEHLRGEFSFVLYDGQKDLIFAARDRFGIKPFCYYKDETKFLIASESKALFEFGIEKAWDEYSFMHSMNMHYRPTDRTLFKNIHQLMPGHFLIYKNGHLQVRKYWDLDYPAENEPKLIKSEREYIEEFRALLAEAVKLRLVSDVPVCFHLSGGLDSSAVVGFARQYLDYKPHCFTITFEGKQDYDESALARETAAFTGSELHEINVSQQDIFCNLSDAVYYSEGLAVNGHLSCKYLLNKKIKSCGFKVALTGEGSDETLAGYPHLRQDIFNQMPTEQKEKLLNDLYKTNLAVTGVEIPLGEGLNLDKVKEKLGFLPSFLQAKATIGHKMRSVLSDDVLNRWQNVDFYEDMVNFYDYENQLKNRNIVNQSLYFWIKLTLANYILDTLGDGCEMSSSIEGRLPFLDHKVFEFARNLPMEMKIKGINEKFILKEAAKPFITQNVYKRQKHPFMSPPVTRFCAEKETEFIQDTLSSENFASIPYFDKNKIKILLNNLKTQDITQLTAMEPVIMLMLTAAFVNERFGL